MGNQFYPPWQPFATLSCLRAEGINAEFDFTQLVPNHRKLARYQWWNNVINTVIYMTVSICGCEST